MVCRLLQFNRRPFPTCYGLATPVGNKYMYCQNVSMLMDLKKKWTLPVKHVNYAFCINFTTPPIQAGDKEIEREFICVCERTSTQVTAIYRYHAVIHVLICCLLNLWFSLCHVGSGNRIDSSCVYYISSDSVWTTVQNMAPTDLQNQPDRKDPSNMGALCTGKCWLSPVIYRACHYFAECQSQRRTRVC